MKIPQSKIGLVPIEGEADEIRMAHVVDERHPDFYLCGMPRSKEDERLPKGRAFIHKFCGNAYAGLQTEREQA